MCVLSDTLSLTLTDLVDQADVVDMHTERIPHVYRATRVAMDNKGFNSVLLQTEPRAW